MLLVRFWFEYIVEMAGLEKRSRKWRAMYAVDTPTTTSRNLQKMRLWRVLCTYGEVDQRGGPDSESQATLKESDISNACNDSQSMEQWVFIIL
jgi:hypothetical protein